MCNSNNICDVFSFQAKALMDKLQKTVSSEGRFKNLRETLKKYVYLQKTFFFNKQQIIHLKYELALIKL